MPSVREIADPHLHALRVVARHVKAQDRVRGSEIETARFNLFKSLESEDYDAGMDWLNSLDMILGCMVTEEHAARVPLGRALKKLRAVLEEETVVEEEEGKQTFGPAFLAGIKEGLRASGDTPQACMDRLLSLETSEDAEKIRAALEPDWDLDWVGAFGRAANKVLGEGV